MALEKKKYLTVAGMNKLATTLFKATNTRISERILSTSSYAGNSADTTHVLSAKAFYDAIGSTSDTAEATTVYGAIAALNATISSLTHLTYQVVTGPIATAVPMAQAEDDVIYLQHKADAYQYNREGLLIDSNGDVVVVGDPAYAGYFDISNGNYYKATPGFGYVISSVELDPTEDEVLLTEGRKLNSEGIVVDENDDVIEGGETGSEYAVFYDPSQDKYFKADKTATYTPTNTALSSDDSIFDGVAPLVDTTYTLYIAQLTRNDQTGETTAVNWIEIGNTDITLQDYVSKNDQDLKFVQDRIIEPISDAEIIGQVRAAFDATDPYSGSSSYLDAWLPVEEP